MKIVTIVGARPQFIKASTISNLIKKYNFFDEVLIHTGQHFDGNMSEIFFKEMKIPHPDYNLNINRLSHAAMIEKMTDALNKILIHEKPSAVIVYGDTNSTLSGSLAASKLGIPIFHIESGLRSFNKSMPEEINRILTDHMSTLLFCPNTNAKNNLSKEGINNGVFVTGDIMYDSFLYFRDKIKKSLRKKNEPYVLTTIHRQENTNNKYKMIDIFSNLDKINNSIPVIMPLHPRTLKLIKKYNISTKIKIIEPLGYLEFLSYLINSNFIITDSGGLQKEAFFAKKKCITVRDETEWIELIDLGVNILSSPDNLVNNFKKIKNNDCDFSKKIYGDGKSGELILNTINNYFNEK